MSSSGESSDGSASGSEDSDIEPTNRDKLQETAKPPPRVVSTVFELGASMERTRAHLQTTIADKMAAELKKHREYAEAASLRRK